MSDSLRPYELQHARIPWPSLSPRVCSNSCPLSQCCHPTASFSVSPFSFCPQFFPASEYFPMRRLFASGGQSIGASVSASVLPMNIQGWFPLGLTGLISLQSKGLSRVFSNTTVQKNQFFNAQPSFWSNSLFNEPSLWSNRWGNNGNSERFIWWGQIPKSLQMVSAAIKLKDPCSLEEKLWQT